ncbi:fungal-specific transcription factor domain-containing protein [Tricladium varicosporioides]|nr:fungal-specific transcription factor domain-containing protein [Hymenoscyphus varicosporioides]
MLEDPAGKLLYLGDSASLSFLQLLRVTIESVAGPSAFTQDPRRHRIVENTRALPPTVRLARLLPDKETAKILLKAYFININGLVDIFDRQIFLSTFDKCYIEPLGIDPAWLCLLYLTFAIGLVMANPETGSEDETVIQKLRAEPMDQAEVFFTTAKQLADPTSGFDDTGLWSIQALILMTIYNLAVSKRNVAYTYCGMAIRFAFALGLHREETLCIFTSTDQLVRRNLLRSLFILDRFLAASLGRPTSIRESDCSGTTLSSTEISSSIEKHETIPKAASLEASTSSCHVIGIVLEDIYSKRKVSTRLAEEILEGCKNWPDGVNPKPHRQQADPIDPSEGIAVLHVSLLHYHSIILLTRPFLLFLIREKHQNDNLNCAKPNDGSKMRGLAESCVVASCQSIELLHRALQGGYVPRRNPFFIYFLFAAALVVSSNEFSCLYHIPNAKASVKHAIDIMQYCSKEDQQAERLLFILTELRNVINKHHSTKHSIAEPSSASFIGQDDSRKADDQQAMSKAVDVKATNPLITSKSLEHTSNIGSTSPSGAEVLQSIDAVLSLAAFAPRNPPLPSSNSKTTFAQPVLNRSLSDPANNTSVHFQMPRSASTPDLLSHDNPTSPSQQHNSIHSTPTYTTGTSIQTMQTLQIGQTSYDLYTRHQLYQPTNIDITTNVAGTDTSSGQGEKSEVGFDTLEPKALAPYIPLSNASVPVRAAFTSTEPIPLSLSQCGSRPAAYDGVYTGTNLV